MNEIDLSFADGNVMVYQASLLLDVYGYSSL
jgi:hypothetical protein